MSKRHLNQSLIFFCSASMLLIAYTLVSLVGIHLCLCLVGISDRALITNAHPEPCCSNKTLFVLTARSEMVWPGKGRGRKKERSSQGSTVRGLEDVGSHEKRLKFQGHILRWTASACYTRTQANSLFIFAKRGVRVIYRFLRYLCLFHLFQTFTKAFINCDISCNVIIAYVIINNVIISFVIISYVIISYVIILYVIISFVIISFVIIRIILLYGH